MLRTEEEAKKKWCPMVRNAFAGYGSGQTYREVSSSNNEDAKCIASDCMMWRKAVDGNDKPIMLHTSEEWSCEHCGGKGKDPKFIYKNPEQPECDNLDGFCYECEGEGHGFKYAPAGFCGLAGKPGGAS